MAVSADLPGGAGGGRLRGRHDADDNRVGVVTGNGGAQRLQSVVVAVSRQCTKTACPGRAVATLTYVYAEQTMVLGPLATYAEPHSYDMCEQHATRMTAPRGWEVVRLDLDDHPPPDDLVALAEAVREHRRPAARPQTDQASSESSVVEVHRRGHLRVLRDR